MSEGVQSQPLMDEEALKAWIWRRLGGGVHDVELCPPHVDDAVEIAIRWFAAKKGVRKLFSVPMYAGVVEYALDGDIDVVVDVIFTAQKMDLALVFSPYTMLDEKIPYDVFASNASGGLYSSYVQTMHYVEMAKRILSVEMDWRQEGHKLFISPIPTNTAYMIIDAKIRVVKLQCLSERDHDLVKRYALAQAREDLAMIRGKFDSYPTAQGTVQMDPDRLLQMANDAKEKLEEEIALSAGPMGFLVG